MIVNAAKAQQAAEVLGVELNGLTPSILGRAYKNKAKECHPDRHGSERLKQWAGVSWANECLKHWLERTPPVEAQELVKTGDCRACNGTGRVEAAPPSGFGKPVTMQCVMCEGHGSMIDKHMGFES